VSARKDPERCPFCHAPVGFFSSLQCAERFECGSIIPVFRLVDWRQGTDPRDLVDAFEAGKALGLNRGKDIDAARQMQFEKGGAHRCNARWPV
jgi:hypothetical protein